MNKLTSSDYREVVQQKLEHARKYLMHGPLGPDHGLIRDDMGVAITFSNILNVSSNLYDVNDGNDPIAQKIANFSGAGFADVSNVATVGAVDVSILTLSNSLVPFLAVDRSMANPDDTVYYDQLVASNNAGGVSENDTVLGNFVPPNPLVNLGPATQSLVPVTGTSGTASGGYVASFSTYLVPGNVVVTIVNGGTTYTGKDYQGDGTIYFNNGFTGTAIVNYEAGSITLNTLPSGYVLHISALEDVTQDEAGSNILKVKTQYTSIPLNSLPKNIIFEQNAASIAYMNKILKNAASVHKGGDYSNVYFQKITDIYIEDINRDLLILLRGIGQLDSNPVLLPLAGYTLTAGAYNATKDDLVHRFFISMRTQFLANTGVSPTVMVTSSAGSAELESNPTKFIKSPGFYSTINGVVGTFDGMPVYRNNYLDTVETANKATFYMAAKLPDNSSGTMVFGEYLPLTQTPTVGNYSNPTQNSVGYYSQVAMKVIQNTLVKRGQISYT